MNIILCNKIIRKSKFYLVYWFEQSLPDVCSGMLQALHRLYELSRNIDVAARRSLVIFHTKEVHMMERRKQIECYDYYNRHK